MRTDSLISAGLLKNSIARFWALGLIYAVVLALIFVVPFSNIIIQSASEIEGASELADAIIAIWSLAMLECVPIAFAAAIIVTQCLGEHLFKPAAATFYGALPLRRRTLFATSYVAGLPVLVAVPALAALAMLGVHVAVPALPVTFVARWFAFMMALTFVFYSIAHACCQLAGTQYVAGILYFVVNFLVVCIEGAIRLLVSALQYGVVGSGLVADWASPFVGFIWRGLQARSSLNGAVVDWPVVVGYCVAGIVFVAIAATLNAHRDMEAAGQPVAFRGARVVLKYLAGVSTALLFGALICIYFNGFSSDASTFGGTRALILLVMMVAGGFFGLLFADMLVSRGTRVLGRCWRGGLVLAVVSVALVGGVYTDALGIVNRVPAASDVVAATVTCNGVEVTLESPQAVEDAVRLQHDLVEYGRDRDRTASDLHEAVTIAYRLKRGSAFERTYDVAVERDAAAGDDEFVIADTGQGLELLRRAAALIDSDEGTKSRFGGLLESGGSGYNIVLEFYDDEGTSESFTVAPSQKADFLEHALKGDLFDKHAADIGGRWPFVREPDGAYANELNAYLAVEDETGNRVLDLWLDAKKTPGCISWFKENLKGVDPDQWKPVSLRADG